MKTPNKIIVEAQLDMLGNEIELPIEFEYEQYSDRTEIITINEINVFSQNFEDDEQIQVSVMDLFSEDELDECANQLISIINKNELK